MSFWHSLYLYFDKSDDVTGVVKDVVQSLDYVLYDPFSNIAGKLYMKTIKMFIAPQKGSWVRITGEFDEQLVIQLSETGLCLSMRLEQAVAHIAAYQQAAEVDFVTAVTPYLKSPCSPDDLKSALLAEIRMNTKPDDGITDGISDGIGIPMDVLPDDVQSMAASLNPKHMNKLFGRMMRRVTKHMGDNPEAARDLLTQGPVDWQSEGGQRIWMIMDCLNIMDDWRNPDFMSLRDAYQLQRRRQRNPNAMLYPGDAEAMQVVPDALDYDPVYAGK